MDIKGLRTLNLIGTILYGLIGTLLVLAYYYQTYDIYSHFNQDLTGCTIVLIIWLFILFTFSILLYQKTVVGLDRGEYKTVKQWTLVGVIIGFMGGIIPLIIFIVSYVSFDEAIRTQQYNQASLHSHPQQKQGRYCNFCKRQIPNDSRLCPYCGRTQLRNSSGQRSTQSLQIRDYKKNRL
jgi:hypothetical protein